MIFSNRKRIAEEALAWCDEHGAAKDAFGVVCALEALGVVLDRPVHVTERLPEDDSYILAFSVHECIPMWRQVRWIGGQWWTLRCTDMEMDEELDQVTHWLPLPPIPE